MILGRSPPTSRSRERMRFVRTPSLAKRKCCSSASGRSCRSGVRSDCGRPRLPERRGIDASTQDSSEWQALPRRPRGDPPGRPHPRRRPRAGAPRRRRQSRLGLIHILLEGREGMRPAPAPTSAPTSLPAHPRSAYATSAITSRRPAGTPASFSTVRASSSGASAAARSATAPT
jgi:hypothetical protein